MKKATIAVTALAATLALGGCGAGNTPAQSTSAAETPSSSASQAAAPESSAASSQAQESEQASPSSAASEKKAAEAKKSSKSTKNDEGSPLSRSTAEALVEDNGYGEVLDMKESKIDGTWYWVVTAALTDGSVHEYKVDPKGNVVANDKTTGSSAAKGSTTKNKLSKSKVEDIIWTQGLGEVVSMKKKTLGDGVQYWQVVTRGADGSKKTFMVDPDGNVSEK